MCLFRRRGPCTTPPCASRGPAHPPNPPQCFFCISMGFVFIQRQELHKLRRGAVDPLAAAGAVAAAVGASGEPMPPGSRASQVTGLGGMIQLGRKDKHGDKEMLL